MKREACDVIAMMLFIAEKTVTFPIIDETHTVHIWQVFNRRCWQQVLIHSK